MIVSLLEKIKAELIVLANKGLGIPTAKLSDINSLLYIVLKAQSGSTGCLPTRAVIVDATDNKSVKNLNFKSSGRMGIIAVAGLDPTHDYYAALYNESLQADALPRSLKCSSDYGTTRTSANDIRLSSGITYPFGCAIYTDIHIG